MRADVFRFAGSFITAEAMIQDDQGEDFSLMKFKLISWNVWSGMYLDKVIAFLQSEKPEVICLQEVGTRGKAQKTNDTNIFNEICQALPEHQGWFMETMQREVGEDVYNLGMATWVSKSLKVTSLEEKFYEQQHSELLVGEWLEVLDRVPRGYIQTGIQLGNTELAVVNTHFTWTKDGKSSEYQREVARNLKKMLQGIEPMVLVGDMNTPYDSETYPILVDGLTDVSLPEQSTLHPTIHKVGNLGYHVDYVFYRGVAIKHVSTRILVVDASDHLPVVVEFVTSD